ncbi:polyprenyl diphosphate synthase [bacterium]|nr:polyprenyl diphosphate synthase [bacterium]
MKKNAPECIGIIMDGNRRWAKERGRPSFEGHAAGYEKLKETVLWAKEAGISYMVAYVFSTENWKRTEEEVSYLMDLIRRMADDLAAEARKNEMKVRFIGTKERLALDIQKKIDEVEEKTREFSRFELVIALSYGGREEILSAVRALLREKREDANEEAFSRALWTASIPDPDLIIRTGGEKRLSGFLPWQTVYSELFFVDTYWPAFTKNDFLEILKEFSTRERRRGI